MNLLPTAYTSTKLSARLRTVLTVFSMQIQDRVESGQIVRGVRGSVRIASERKAPAIPADDQLMHEPKPALALQV